MKIKIDESGFHFQPETNCEEVMMWNFHESITRLPENMAPTSSLKISLGNGNYSALRDPMIEEQVDEMRRQQREFSFLEKSRISATKLP